MAKHRLRESRGLGFQYSDFLGRSLRDRPGKGGKLDFGRQIQTACHRAQGVGQAFLFPAIRLASLPVEKIERSGEGPVEPFLLFDEDD